MNHQKIREKNLGPTKNWKNQKYIECFTNKKCDFKTDNETVKKLYRLKEALQDLSRELKKKLFYEDISVEE